MRKVKIEVKTIYNIRFDFHDFVKIFAAAKEDPARINAFSDFDLEDTTMGNLRNCFDSLRGCSFFLEDNGRQRAKNLEYIVNKLGFDGISHYGGMYDDETEYSITVYNYGADI